MENVSETVEIVYDSLKQLFRSHVLRWLKFVRGYLVLQILSHTSLIQIAQH